jgi:hypothetical protein
MSDILNQTGIVFDQFEHPPHQKSPLMADKIQEWKELGYKENHCYSWWSTKVDIRVSTDQLK